MKIKKCLKAVTCVVLSCILVNLSITANALTAERVDFNEKTLDPGFQSCLDVLYNEPTSIGIYDNMSSAIIGKSFKIYAIKDTKAQLVDNVSYYPVFVNNNVVALITEASLGNNKYYSTGQSFSKSLNSILEANSSVAIFTDENNNLFSIDMQNNVLQLTNQETDISFSSQAFDNVSYSQLFNRVEKSSDSSVMIKDIVSYQNSSRAVSSKKLSNYPQLVQTDNHNCWAFSILSMAKYKLGSSKTYQDVLNAYKAGNGYAYDGLGASVTEAYKTICQMFTGSVYSPHKYNSYLQSGQIKNSINANYPIYIAGTNTEDSTKGHAEVIYGYIANDSNVTNLFLMDPQNGNYSSAYIGTTGTWTFNDYMGRMYTWNGSVTLRLF